MANTVTPTNGTHERQERYANAVVALMRPDLLIRNLFSKEYEGSPKAGAVKIPVRGDVSVVDYDVVSGASLATSATTYFDLPINKNKVINELIDGYEAEAVPDNLVAQRLESGAYGLAAQLEADTIATLKTTNNFTASKSAGTASTGSTIYKNILDDIAQVKKLGVKSKDIKVAISYDTEVLLLTDNKYSDSCGQLGDKQKQEGIVGRINGCDVVTEELGKLGSGSSATDVEYIVFAPAWCAAVDEFTINPRVVDIKDGAHVGASKLEGRMVYGTAVTNKKAVVVK